MARRTIPSTSSVTKAHQTMKLNEAIHLRRVRRKRLASLRAPDSLHHRHETLERVARMTISSTSSVIKAHLTTKPNAAICLRNVRRQHLSLRAPDSLVHRHEALDRVTRMTIPSTSSVTKIYRAFMLSAAIHLRITGRQRLALRSTNSWNHRRNNQSIQIQPQMVQAYRIN